MSQGSNGPRLDAEEILDGVLRWVDVETPSHDAAAVNRLADQVEDGMAALGARIERTPGRDGYGDILKARSPWGDDDTPGILVLSHLDTVHAVGTKAEALPVRRDGERVFGPGIYDMKAGAYIAYHAFRHLFRAGRRTPLPITFLYMPDEEVGSPTSRALIEAEARRNKYVLVTEPARDGGQIVTARKGVIHYRVTVTGRPAHAGARHEDGRSAIREMARQILRFEALTDYARDITCSVGTLSGGSAINVVPASCRAEIDMRVPSRETAREMLETIRGFTPFDPDCALAIEIDENRPPFEKDAGIAALFEHAKGLAAEIGFELKDQKTGGGSDGNFTAALGIPTLDGLGADGHGAHTHEEHIFYDSLVERTQLMIRMFETLE